MENLFDACRNNNVARVIALINEGVNIHENNNMALLICVETNNIPLTTRLIEAGANVNNGDILAAANNLDMVNLLINAGAIVTRNNNSALKRACIMGRLDIVGRLINARADVNDNGGGGSPLSYAIRGEQIAVIDQLFISGARVKEFNLEQVIQSNNVLLLEKLLAQPRIPMGHDILFYSIPRGIVMFNMLINAGANINENQKIEELLSHAIMYDKAEIFLKILQFIPVIRNNQVLVIAVHSNNVQFVTLLIQKGANIHFNNERPLKIAIIKQNIDIVRLLITNGANIHVDNQYCIGLAARLGNLKILEILINAGANINIPDVYNPLLQHIQSEAFNMDIINKLIEAGANVNVLNGRLLEEAVSRENVELVSRLIEAGANVQLKDNEALKIARRKNNLRIIEILERAGANLPPAPPIIPIQRNQNVPPPPPVDQNARPLIRQGAVGMGQVLPPPPQVRGLARLPAGVGLRAEDAPPPPQFPQNLGLRRMGALPNAPPGIDIRIAGGYYEKYLKYKRKYLSLKKDI
jgi:ankyrin repeat protein